MKESEFCKKYPIEEISVPIYFTLDDEDNVRIDYEGIQKEFGNKLKDILLNVNPDVLGVEKDELKEMLKKKVENETDI